MMVDCFSLNLSVKAPLEYYVFVLSYIKCYIHDVMWDFINHKRKNIVIKEILHEFPFGDSGLVKEN